MTKATTTEAASMLNFLIAFAFKWVVMGLLLCWIVSHHAAEFERLVCLALLVLISRMPLPKIVSK
jgi:hypothetical protein